MKNIILFALMVFISADMNAMEIRTNSPRIEIIDDVFKAAKKDGEPDYIQGLMDELAIKIQKSFSLMKPEEFSSRKKIALLITMSEILEITLKNAGLAAINAAKTAAMEASLEASFDAATCVSDYKSMCEQYGEDCMPFYKFIKEVRKATNKKNQREAEKEACERTYEKFRNSAFDEAYYAAYLAVTEFSCMDNARKESIRAVNKISLEVAYKKAYETAYETACQDDVDNLFRVTEWMLIKYVIYSFESIFKDIFTAAFSGLTDDKEINSSQGCPLYRQICQKFFSGLSNDAKRFLAPWLKHLLSIEELGYVTN